MSSEDTSENPEGEKPYDVEAVNRRKDAITNALDVPELTGYEGSDSLKKFWLGEFGEEEVQKAIDRNEKMWGSPEALVVSFTDASLQIDSDAGFAGQFFNAFGAHVTLDDGVLEMDPTPGTIETALSLYNNLPRLSTDTGLNDLMDNLPPGSFIVTNEYDKPTHLVCETDLEGVRLVLEGPGISKPKGANRSVRPMLLIKMADEKFEPTGQPEEDHRKTWLEIHGREPGAATEIKDLGKELGDETVLEDSEGAAALYKWMPEVKGGKDILVTPTTLKENPALPEDERPDIVTEAYSRALEHAELADQGKAPELIARSRWALYIMADLLQMTPEEIMKDGEAMGTLVEYLDQVARARPNIYGASDLLPPAEEGNELAELTALIKDTWNFPGQSGLSSDMLFDRVNWIDRPDRNILN